MIVAATRLLGVVACALLACLAISGQARATSFSSTDAFYFPVNAESGYGGVSPYGASGGIAASPDGNYLYVAAGAVYQYATDGAFVRRFAISKAFLGATSVGTDLFGNVYVLYRASQRVVKFTANGKYLTSWPVTFARSIGVSRAGHVYVLTNFLNAVGEYNSAGKSIGGFVANFPGQFFPWTKINDPGIVPESGYDPPYKTDATAITVTPSGDPVIAGDSSQGLSNQPPQCSAHAGFDDPVEFANPLVSGEVVRFTPSGTLPEWGWLTGSDRDCYGWQSDAETPDGVAIDPNTGGTYATSPWDLGVIPAALPASPYTDPGDDYSRINLYGPPCYAYSCPTLEDAEYIAGNPPVGVALDCHSNLYMLSNTANGEFVTKFLNQDQGQASSCFNPRFSLAPRLTVLRISSPIKIGKEQLLMGCSGRLCSGTLTLRSASLFCRGCTLTGARHFRIRPGHQVTLSVRLLKLGRRLLELHPGIPITIAGKLKGGRAFTQSATLRAPATLSERCAFAGTAGGAADVSGMLLPAHVGDAITVDYLPPETNGALVPVVQHSVRTDRSGRFSDRYTLARGGNWMVFVSWAGNRTREPVVSRPCSGTVEKVQTQITLHCPASPAVGVPANFSGTLSGAPADAPVSVVYVPPSEIPIGHSPGTTNTGSYADSLSPTEPGTWQAMARYNGDGGHTAAQANCPFTVVPDDFSIKAVPSSGFVAPGGSISLAIDTSVTSGVSQSITLSSSGAFPGTVAFAHSTIGTGSSSAAKITTTASAAPGTYVITFTGAGPWATHSTTYRLTVLRPTDLTLACSADPNRQFISCDGNLTTTGGTGVGSAKITVTYTPPSNSGQPQTVHTATTAANGSYSDMLHPPPGSLIASGSWQVQARFAGDATNAPASNTQNVSVP